VSGTGVRARNRLTTEQAIEDAALTLMASRGFTAVTGAEIAALAGVTERTFFRYCPSKVDSLLFVSRDVHDGIGAAVPGPVDFGTLVDVVAGVLEEFEDARPDALDRLVRVRSLLVADPGLLAAMLERDAAQTMALQRDWHGADPFAVPLALLALRVAFDAWAGHPDGATLAEAFRSACARLRSAVGS
jgi:AcrR family transcriptional regulator